VTLTLHGPTRPTRQTRDQPSGRRNDATILGPRRFTTPACPPVTAEEVPAGGDAGYSVLELAVVLPFFIVLLMLVFQAATVWYGRGIVQATAREGLRAAEAYNATADDGQTRASDYLQQVAPNALTGPHIDVSRGADTVTVTVTAHVPALVPFATFTVHAHATGPVERYRPPP
jgi:hypothetical protein